MLPVKASPPRATPSMRTVEPKRFAGRMPMASTWFTPSSTALRPPSALKMDTSWGIDVIGTR